MTNPPVVAEGEDGQDGAELPNIAAEPPYPVRIGTPCTGCAGDAEPVGSANPLAAGLVATTSEAAAQPAVQALREQESQRVEAWLLVALVALVLVFLGFQMWLGTEIDSRSVAILMGIVAALATVAFRKRVGATTAKVVLLSMIGFAVGAIAMATVVKAGADGVISVATWMKSTAQRRSSIGAHAAAVDVGEDAG
ncbi:hypothetical protein ACFVMC_14035 [Nocardia sp. NPDC127579]|uniref:hypothetical protein n=1 Tax=Nocardia sp. NPDC127579 TaxID=3345402 RepID=UPI0036347902